MSAPFQSCIPLFNICQVPPAWAAPKLGEKHHHSPFWGSRDLSCPPAPPAPAPLLSGLQRWVWLQVTWASGKGTGGLRSSLQDKAVCIWSSWKGIASRTAFSQAFPGIILQHMKCWFIDKVIFSEDRCLLETLCGWWHAVLLDVLSTILLCCYFSVLKQNVIVSWVPLTDLRSTSSNISKTT